MPVMRTVLGGVLAAFSLVSAVSAQTGSAMEILERGNPSSGGEWK